MVGGLEGESKWGLSEPEEREGVFGLGQSVL